MLCVCGCSIGNCCLPIGWIRCTLRFSNQNTNWYSIKQLSQHTELVTTSTSYKWTLTQGFCVENILPLEDKFVWLHCIQKGSSTPSPCPTSLPGATGTNGGGGASGTTYHFAKATWLFHSVFYPTLTLGVNKFRYLILNKKIVINLVHIQGMSDFFYWRETVKTLFYLSYTDTGNQSLREIDSKWKCNIKIMLCS